ncbi:MAG TPA: DUF177 domain-containing protein [Oligoflexia bacterium]|nr:DUF177 domain-containing protein [Oligoflexia bacterium]
MKIYFHELSEEPKHLTFTQAEAWLAEAVCQTWETSVEDAVTPSLSPTPYTVDFELRRSQEMIFLKGTLIDVAVELLCSRCATPFFQKISGKFQGIYSRSRDLLEKKKGTIGVAYSEPTGGTEDDLDIEYLEKDSLELADVLKEHLYLKIPFQPLCSDACKGVCPTCGQNQNTDPCQCHRLREGPLAKALAKTKIRVD